MKEKANNETKWHKLDNTAIIFPVISNKRLTSVYRVAVTLNQEIKENILETAVKETLKYFKNFRVRLRRGLFWYYFETNKKAPFIEQEQDYPCAFIDQLTNNNFLFKVTYFNRRINLEVFHAITDGRGAIEFLKAITLNYIKVANHKELSEQVLKMPAVEVVADPEDSYIKNYKKVKVKPSKPSKAYHMKAKKIQLSTASVIHGHISTSEILSLCKKNNATVTQYLTALLIFCIYKEYMNGQPSNRSINIGIPVDLRKYFGSTTSANFFSFFFAGFRPTKEEYIFEEILEEVTAQFKRELTKESLSNKISLNVAKEKNMSIRFIPLFVKNIVIKAIYKREAKAATSALSNLGKIEVPDEFKKYIDYFSFVLSSTESDAIKCGVCSFEDKLVCTITSKFENSYLERAFFRHLQSEGINVIIESNGVRNEEL